MSNSLQLMADRGIHFMTDSGGKRIAAVIDIEKHGDLLEELFDIIVSKEQLAEGDFISLSELKEELIKADKL
ncbi:MAG: hypothetical protein AAF741_04935 [Bacteroidota bacterium]